MSDSEEYEEHDYFVHMDFHSRVDNDLLDDLKQFKLIGLTEEKPVLQLGEEVYQGEWQDTIGSHLFLRLLGEDKSDPLNDQDYPLYELAHSTEKLLHMKRIFLNPKSQKSDPETSANSDVTMKAEPEPSNAAEVT